MDLFYGTPEVDNEGSIEALLQESQYSACLAVYSASLRVAFGCT